MANLAEHKESFVSNRRQYKRHVRNQWTYGQASRAVDGDIRSSLPSCTLLDNYYVDKPVWMVDLGARTLVSGVVIITWQSSEQPNNNGKCHYIPHHRRLQRGHGSLGCEREVEKTFPTVSTV